MQILLQGFLYIKIFIREGKFALFPFFVQKNGDADEQRKTPIITGSVCVRARSEVCVSRVFSWSPCNGQNHSFVQTCLGLLCAGHSAWHSRAKGSLLLISLSAYCVKDWRAHYAHHRCAIMCGKRVQETGQAGGAVWPHGRSLSLQESEKPCSKRSWKMREWWVS